MMKLELTSTKTNPLIGRREVAFKIEEKSTPNRSGIKVELATALRVNLDQVYVQEIETKSGTHVTLGVAHVYDERDPAVKWMIEHVIKIAKKRKKKIGICGQGPSDHEDFAAWLVKQGIDSMSLNPDTVLKTTLMVLKKEKNRKRR